MAPTITELARDSGSDELGVIYHFGSTRSFEAAFEEMTVPCDKQLRLLHLQSQNLRVARDLLLPPSHERGDHI